MRLLLVWITVVATALATNELARSNFLFGGQRTSEDIEATRRALAELGRETQKQIGSGDKRRTLAFSTDDIVNVPSAPAEPMSEQTLNREAGINDYLYQARSSQGDIAMTAEQVAERLSERRQKRSYIRNADFPKTKWNPDHVPYYFDPSLPSITRTRAREAMDYYEQHTCLRFFQNYTATPRLRLFFGSGCWSYVGRQSSWETQDLSYGKDCNEHFGIMTHELMHAMGFYHEQARTDRDDYIIVNGFNIAKANSVQFNRETKETSDDFGMKYEYGSVMHYASDLMAVDRTVPVLVARDRRHQNTMGNRMSPSFQDIRQINTLYDCEKKCTSPISCLNGGYQSPVDCSICLCPYGYGGARCEGLQQATEYNKDCGAIVTATNEWTKLEGVVVTTATSGNAFLFKPEQCWWQIKAAPGQLISVHFKEIKSECFAACTYNSIEVKVGNFNQTGYRVCCDEDVKTDFQSLSNIMIIGASARIRQTKFELYHIAY